MKIEKVIYLQSIEEDYLGQGFVKWVIFEETKLRFIYHS